MSPTFDSNLHIRGNMNTVSKEQEDKICSVFPSDVYSAGWGAIEKQSLEKDITKDTWQHKLAILNC